MTDMEKTFEVDFFYLGWLTFAPAVCELKGCFSVNTLIV